MNTEMRDCLIEIKKAAIDVHIKCQDLSNNEFMKLMTAKGQIYLCIEDDMGAEEILSRIPLLEQVCDVIVEKLQNGTFRLIKNRDNKIPDRPLQEEELESLVSQWWK